MLFWDLEVLADVDVSTTTMVFCFESGRYHGFLHVFREFEVFDRKSRRFPLIRCVNTLV